MVEQGMEQLAAEQGMEELDGMQQLVAEQKMEKLHGWSRKKGRAEMGVVSMSGRGRMAGRHRRKVKVALCLWESDGDAPATAKRKQMVTTEGKATAAHRKILAA
jgi:hypothetical protein